MWFRPLYTLLLVSIMSGTAYSQTDTTEHYNTQAGFSSGIVHPTLRDLGNITTAKAKNGMYLSINLNRDYLRGNKPFYLSGGIRLTYFSFQTTQTVKDSLLYIFLTGNTRTWNIGTFSIGIPILVNYHKAIGRNTELNTGLGIYTCLQYPHLREPKFPVRAYANGYIGFNFRQKLRINLELGQSFINFPNNANYLAGFSIFNAGIGFRYAIVRVKQKDS